MRYAVYYQPNDEMEIDFFKTKQEALDKIDELIKKQEQEEVDSEKNLFWDITLLEIVSEVKRSTRDGSLVLRTLSF